VSHKEFCVVDIRQIGIFLWLFRKSARYFASFIYDKLVNFFGSLRSQICFRYVTHKEFCVVDISQIGKFLWLFRKSARWFASFIYDKLVNFFGSLGSLHCFRYVSLKEFCDVDI